MLLSRHVVGTYAEMSSYATCQETFGQSSRLTEQLWTDPGLKSRISVHKLTSTSKKKKKKGTGRKSLQTRKKPPPSPPLVLKESIFEADPMGCMHRQVSPDLKRGRANACF